MVDSKENYKFDQGAKGLESLGVSNSRLPESEKSKNNSLDT